MTPSKILAAILANSKSKTGLFIVGFFVLISIIGPFLCHDPKAFLSVPLSPPSADNWFGTTGMGQDVLAQTIVGSRMTLFISFVAGFFITFIGAFIGFLFCLKETQGIIGNLNARLL